jgi:large subunit ribosomal protein L21
MFAIIQTGGKQYRVATNDVIRVEKLHVEAGATVEFQTILVAGETMLVGEAAAAVKVTGQVLAQVRGAKIYIDKYKSGIQYRRRNGHRQHYTDVKITGIAA